MEAPTTTRTLGTFGTVPALALGCMGMSDLDGPADRAESLATVRAALDAGVTLLDTGDFYGAGHNELLLREAAAGRRREDVLLSVEFEAPRDRPAGGRARRPAGRGEERAGDDWQRLGADHVDVHRRARLDPIVDTVGAIAEMVQAGYVRHVGLSDVDAEAIRRAPGQRRADRVLAAVAEHRASGVLATRRELGIGVTAYGVLSRGLLSGHWRPGSARATSAGEPALPGREPHPQPRAGRAAARGGAAARVTVARLAIAGVLHRGDDVVPLVGARRRDRLAESLGALAVGQPAAVAADAARAGPHAAPHRRRA